MITASIVIYNSGREELAAVLGCCHACAADRIYVVDNGPDGDLRDFSAGLSPRVEYIHGHGNVGYGAGHNIAIRLSRAAGSDYHVVVNPDISFEPGTLELLAGFMDANPDVGLAMPKVIYPGGETQYLCKLLPSPADLIFRRFLAPLPGADRRNDMYELRGMDYGRTHFGVPSLSGCFMFFRTSALERLDGFDERFFMYMEDVDLCRRTHAVARTAFFPGAVVRHDYRKGSYNSSKLLKYHMTSAVKYFNKWGWMFDGGRKALNRRFTAGAGLR